MIEVKHLTKKYGDHVAVSDLSFTIEKGQIYGFLGPNGAGKSTTMNIMTGCLAATEGEVSIGGYDIFEQPEKAKSLIGYLPEQPPVYMDSTPGEYLRFVAQAKGVPSRQLASEVSRVMELTQITEMKDRLIKHLSKGYRQRVGIAQALLGDPEVIILDEPTVGLDPRQIIEIRELIKGLGEDHTVILSSHILSEVQAVCQTILIIAGGKMVACDTADNLEDLFKGNTRIELFAEASEEEIPQILSGLGEDAEISVAAAENGCNVTVTAPAEAGNDLCRTIFFAFSAAGKAILRMNMAKASLEDVFIELTESNAAAEESAPAPQAPETTSESEVA